MYGASVPAAAGEAAKRDQSNQRNDDAEDDAPKQRDHDTDDDQDAANADARVHGFRLSTGRFSEPLPTERIPGFCDDHASIGRAQRRGLVRAAGGSLGRCSARKAPLLPQCGHDQYHARSRSLPQKSRSVEAAAEWPRSTTEKSGSSQARHTRTQLSAERPRRRPVGESGGRARSFDMLILEFVMPDRLNAQSPLGRLGRRHPARPAGRPPAHHNEAVIATVGALFATATEPLERKARSVTQPSPRSARARGVPARDPSVRLSVAGYKGTPRTAVVSLLAVTRGRLTGSVDGYRTACRRGPARGGFERESVPTSPR